MLCAAKTAIVRRSSTGGSQLRRMTTNPKSKEKTAGTGIQVDTDPSFPARSHSVTEWLSRNVEGVVDQQELTRQVWTTVALMRRARMAQLPSARIL